MPAIMFLTNVMNKQTENNKQTNCYLKVFYSKTHKFTDKSNSSNTDCIVDTYPRVKLAEHVAKIDTKIMSQIGHISQFFLKNRSKMYKTSMKHLLVHKYPFNNVLCLRIMCKMYVYLKNLYYGC